jgi:cell division protein DivIC
MEKRQLREKGKAKNLEKKSRNKKRAIYNYMGMFGITLIVFILLFALMIKSRTEAGRLAVYNAKAASLKEEIQDEKDRTEEIEALKAHMETDEYVEEVARDKLGLVKDNEIVFREAK